MNLSRVNVREVALHPRQSLAPAHLRPDRRLSKLPALTAPLERQEIIGKGLGCAPEVRVDPLAGGRFERSRAA